MASVFWDSDGTLLVEFLERSATVNSERYVEALKKLKQWIRRVRPNRKMNQVLPIHRNVRPHTTMRTREEISTIGWTVLPHIPYSPDWAPSDIHLFGSLKDALRGRRFRMGRAETQRVWRAPTLQQRVRWPVYKVSRKGGKRVLTMKETVEKNIFNIIFTVHLVYIKFEIKTNLMHPHY
jgi:hypothetical protein